MNLKMFGKIADFNSTVLHETARLRITTLELEIKTRRPKTTWERRMGRAGTSGAGHGNHLCRSFISKSMDLTRPCDELHFSSSALKH